MPLYVPLLFMAVPLVICAVWVFVFRAHRRVARQFRTVPPGWVAAPWPGTVTDERTWRTSHRHADGTHSSAIVHRPIVTYRPSSGGDVTFMSGLYGTFMPRPGAQVAVLHDPADPSRARIAPESIPKTFRRLSTAVFVLAVVVLVPLTTIFELLGWFMLTHR